VSAAQDKFGQLKMEDILSTSLAPNTPKSIIYLSNVTLCIAANLNVIPISPDFRAA